MRLCRVLDVEARPNPRDSIFTFITMSFSEHRQSFGSANEGNCPICFFDGFELSHGMMKEQEPCQHSAPFFEVQRFSKALCVSFHANLTPLL